MLTSSGAEKPNHTAAVVDAVGGTDRTLLGDRALSAMRCLHGYPVRRLDAVSGVVIEVFQNVKALLQLGGLVVIALTHGLRGPRRRLPRRTTWFRRNGTGLSRCSLKFE